MRLQASVTETIDISSDLVSIEVLEFDALAADVDLSLRIDDEGFGHLSGEALSCLLYTSPSPRDATLYRMPSSA